MLATRKRRQNVMPFHQEFERLNPRQRRAVDTIEGPLLVVAGPGTGKTHVVALRVANILRKTQANPYNVLCLTFSKSGATAMRDRLRMIIGSDAYGVTVNTIHGFCNDIIIQHPSVFEDWSSLHQITDVERYRELNKIIDQLPADAVLINPKSPYSRTADILGRISQLKREGAVERAALLDVADAYERQMSEKSREGTKEHGKNLLSSQKFRAFLEIFFRYQEMLVRTNRYDYEDMILNVITALQREDWLLAGLQERYQYILVDEFQDTNGAQARLIEILTEDPTADNQPNLCVVGDDDQAIYRFQGANLANILSFRARFPGAPVIALTHSYRCTQPILDAATALIAHNTERLVGRIDGLSKELVADHKDRAVDPLLIFAASDTSEPWLVADLVEERLQKGMDPEEIAVIVQTNVELIPLHDVLQSRGIPFQLAGKLDLLSHPIVQQVIAILRAIDEPRSDASLASALACACFGCHPADLAVLYGQRREQDKRLLEVLLSLEENNDMRLRDRGSVLHARDTILDLHNKKDHRTVMETLERVYRDCSVLGSFARGEMDIIDFAAAQEFFDQIKRRALENPHFSFTVFLSDLEYYGNPDYKDVRLSYDLPHLTRTGVQLMTAHKSKGLEFETVIVVNFREGHWDKRRHPPAVSVPEDLLFGWEKEQRRFEQNQDERRVAYVAMTRAKRELIFTCPRELTTGDSAKAVSPSAFFAEAGNLPEQDREVREPGKMSTLLSGPVRSFDSEYEAYLRQKLEQFALSPTALRTFLEDPNEFLEVYLLERPQAKEPVFAYGNAVHHALARWALNVQTGKPMDTDALLKEFRQHLAQKEILTDQQRARFEHLGDQALRRYAAECLQPPFPIVHRIEHAITTRLLDPKHPGKEGIPMKGKIDRIELKVPGSSLAIVRDFKTGKPKSEAQCKTYGYVQQLAFYGLLMMHGYSIVQPGEYIIDFIGEGEDGPRQRQFAIGEQDMKELRLLIEQVWSKITALDFTPL